MVNPNEGLVIAQKVRELIHRHDPKFWVPAVENGGLGELLKFVETNGLWQELQAIVKKEK